MVSFLVIYVVYFEKLPTSQMHTFYSLVKLFDWKEDKVTQDNNNNINTNNNNKTK